MVQKGAPESDIDAYISQSGTNVDAIKNFKLDAPKEETLYDPKTGIPYTRSQRQEAATDFGEGIKTGIKETPFWLNDAVNAGVGAMGAKPPLDGSKEIYDAVGAPITEPKGMGQLGNIVGGTAGMIGAAGAVPKMAESLVSKGAKAEEIIPTAKAKKAESTALYNELPESKSTLTPAWTDKFLKKLDQFKPQTEIGKEFIGNTEISSLIDQANKTLAGKPITLQAAQEIDEHLSEQISKHYGVTGLDKQGQKIMEFQDEFRESMHPSNLTEEDIQGGKEGFEKWKLAQSKWHDAAKMRDIEKIMTRAGQSDNPATAMKTGFRTLYNNEKRMRGFSAEERALIKDAAEGHFTDNFMKILGSRLRPIIASAGGGGMAGTAGAYVTSNLARGAAEKLQFNRAMKVINEIAREKPAKTAAQAIGSDTDPIGAIQQYYKDSPESASKRWNP